MSTPYVLAVVLAAVIPWTLRRAHRFDDGIVEHWARDHGVELTGESRPIVRRYLRRSRLLRTWGGVAGAILPSLVDYVVNGRVQVLGFGTDGESAPLGFGTIFIGYLLGALCAELSFGRPVTRGRRVASLARRELEDYLPRRVALAQRALTVAGALGIATIGLVPYPDSFSTPGASGLATAALGVLAFGAGLEAVERWVVRRPQPYTSAPLVAADDAIRAQSVRAVSGAGLALLLLLCCGVALALQAADVAALRTTMVVPAAACLLAALVVCQDVSEGRWRVRRRGRAQPVASA